MEKKEILKTAELIKKAIKKKPDDITAYEDYFGMVRAMGEADKKLSFEYDLWLRSETAKQVRMQTDGKLIEKFYELNKKTYLYMAPDDFHSYLITLEWNRPVAQRFYQPRMRIMKRVTSALQKLTDGELDELFLSEPPRVGKLLADDTPILTTNGWKNHGDLVVGDYVYNPNGKPSKVIAVHPKYHTTHKVILTDGSEFECHFRHEWRVWDRSRNMEIILETQDMIGHTNLHGTEKVREHRYRYMIETRPPIEGKEKNLPVAPYTFGAWLGDGHNIQPRITGDAKDAEIIQRIIQDGYEKEHEYVHNKTKVVTTSFGKLRADLNKIGLCHTRERREKYIPQEYLTASLEQRLDLLAGLLDTDGSLRRKENRYDFTTSEEMLKEDFVSLIGTFGWRTSVKTMEPKVSNSGIKGKKAFWTVSFNPTMFIPCALERKRLYTFSKQRRLAIKSIEPCKPKQGNCITVEGDGMYLAGRKLIPTHNTTMLMFYVTWLVGRDSEKSNLYSAYSDTITSAFYNGCLEVINDPTTYLWHDVFPSAKLVATNSKDETLNIDRKKRYPSLTCRSLYGTLNGACDCNGVLISDDLIGGIEEALNKDRLVAAWSKVDNNLIPRAKETAKILWCGTRWSLVDPTGLRMELLLNDDKFKGRKFDIINLPALNDNDESNFEYDYGVGFSTEYYRMRRASFERNNDMASWEAQYMGKPIERSGALFDPADMKYYNGTLPDETPVRIFMAVDPAFGGGDFVAAPICYQYEDGRVFVHDVVYSDADKKITQPLIVSKIIYHKVQAADFEVTKSTAAYKEVIEEALKEKGHKLNITSHSAPTNVAKEIRIRDKAPEIREMYYIESGKRSKEYELFMQNVFSFSITGKNKHDDAPDSLAQAVDMIRGVKTAVIEIGNRTF